MRARLLVTTTAAAIGLTAATTFTRAEQDRDAGSRTRGAVYTMSNATSGNEILVFDRHSDGTLSPAGSIATGGAGTGAGLGNQGGLVLADEGRWLLAVNAASNTVSLFDVEGRGLRFSDQVDSGGVRPISIASDEEVVYVLNADSDNISGFRIRRGRLVPLPQSTRALSGSGTGPAEVAFSPDGRLLIVTEKNTNLIDTFRVGEDGLAGPAIPHQAHGQTPFGFAFGGREHLFVSEAFGGAQDASSVSSYRTHRDGSLDLIDGSVGTHQTAACWVLVTRDGRFAYATNTGSGSISGYRISHDGRLALLNPDGRTANTGAGSSPIDLATNRDGGFLYSLNSGTDTIGVFGIGPDGRLAALQLVQGLPVGADGLAAR